MKDCASECLKKNEGCKKEECRLWIDYKEDTDFETILAADRIARIESAAVLQDVARLGATAD